MKASCSNRATTGINALSIKACFHTDPLHINELCVQFIQDEQGNILLLDCQAFRDGFHTDDVLQHQQIPLLRIKPLNKMLKELPVLFITWIFFIAD